MISCHGFKYIALKISVCDYNSLQSTGSIWNYENIVPSHTETLNFLFNKKRNSQKQTACADKG